MLHPSRLRAGLLAILLAMLVLVAGGASQPGGSSRVQLHSAAAKGKPSGVDVGAVIEAVRHRVAPVPGTPGLLRAEDRVYRADFDRSGVAVTLRSEPSRSPRAFEATPALRVRTVVASRGGRPFAISPGSWRPDRNEVRRGLAMVSVSSHCTGGRAPVGLSARGHPGRLRHAADRGRPRGSRRPDAPQRGLALAACAGACAAAGRASRAGCPRPELYRSALAATRGE